MDQVNRCYTGNNSLFYKHTDGFTQIHKTQQNILLEEQGIEFCLDIFTGVEIQWQLTERNITERVIEIIHVIFKVRFSGIMGKKEDNGDNKKMNVKENKRKKRKDQTHTILKHRDGNHYPGKLYSIAASHVLNRFISHKRAGCDYTPQACMLLSSPVVLPQ